MDEPQNRAVSAALRYLASKNALHKLSTPVPVIGRDVVFCITSWQTPPAEHDVLPPLEKGARI
jgi:hypothetical protein